MQVRVSIKGESMKEYRGLALCKNDRERRQACRCVTARNMMSKCEGCTKSASVAGTVKSDRHEEVQEWKRDKV